MREGRDMQAQAIGVDVGGTGIKAGVVEVDTGVRLGEQLHVPTPTGAEPEAVAAEVRALVARLGLSDAHPRPVGVCLPSIVAGGRALSASNISADWLGLDARMLFQQALGTPVHVLNDADAAGVAEAAFGAARTSSGLVMLVTLGTGLGTAMVHDGVLVPNCELGHLEINGVDWETRASVAVKERESLTWEQWADRLQVYFTHLEALTTPDRFVVGGAISAAADSFLPLLDLRTPIVPAVLGNDAGLTGAAFLAARSRTHAGSVGR